jgi:hypothetical protein
MRTVLVNLSNKLFENSRLRLNESARKWGISEIRSYDFEDIRSTPFYNSNREILDQSAGLGYWLWKPYIIRATLETLSEGDVLVYCDSGIEIIRPPDPLLSICREQQPVVLFGNGNHLNSMWTKRDCFVLMDCDSELYWRALQCDAGCCLFRKTDVALQFVEEWERYACDKRILTDISNTCGKPNLPDFVAHRHDQSILSLLVQRYKMPLFRMPTQFGNHYKMQAFRVEDEFNRPNQMSTAQVGFYAAIPYYNSPYPQLLDHHRRTDGSVPGQSSALLPKIKRKWKRTIWSIRNKRPYTDIGK